jgi:hypothetical protein
MISPGGMLVVRSERTWGTTLPIRRAPHQRQVKRHAQSGSHEGIGKAHPAPAICIEQPCRQRPPYWAGEPAPEPERHDGVAGFPAKRTAKRNESGVVESQPMPTPSTRRAAR